MNTKEIQAFKKAEARFQEAVAKHLRDGWQINAATMNGTQGEQARIDFRKGSTIHRITLENEYSQYDDDTDEYYDAWAIHEYTHRAEKGDFDHPSWHRTLWEQNATNHMQENIRYR